MINFRYHLISLVAVFLALSIGIVMGSTVIDRAIVDSLRSQIDKAERNSIERKDENDRLNEAIRKQNEQNTVLAAHVVQGVLAGQSTYILTIGDVPDATRVEVQELLAVSQARNESVIRFSSDFLSRDKANIAKELLKIENISTLVEGEKNVNSQIMITLSTALAVQAGAVAPVAVNAELTLQTLSNVGAITQEDRTNIHDPIQPVSFIVLINREALKEKETISFVQHLYTSIPLSVGLVGSDTAIPSRAKSVELLGDQLVNISVVDNIESPSGRAALLVAHAQNLTGIRQTYGISSKAQSPAPILQDL